MGEPAGKIQQNRGIARKCERTGSNFSTVQNYEMRVNFTANSDKTISKWKQAVTKMQVIQNLVLPNVISFHHIATWYVTWSVISKQSFRSSGKLNVCRKYVLIHSMSFSVQLKKHTSVLSC